MKLASRPKPSYCTLSSCTLCKDHIIILHRVDVDGNLHIDIIVRTVVNKLYELILFFFSSFEECSAKV
jgi:hypothetical protein